MSIRSWVHLLVCCLVLPLACTGDSFICAQVAATPIVSAHRITVSANELSSRAESVSEGSTSSEEAESGEEEKPLDERRVEALLEANVDRSLPTVLKAWSAQKQADDEESKPSSKNKNKGTSATVANVFEGFVVFELEKKSRFKKDSTVNVLVDEAVVGEFKILTVEEKKLSGKFQAKNEADAATESDQKKAADKAGPEDDAPIKGSIKSDQQQAKAKAEETDADADETDKSESPSETAKDDDAKAESAAAADTTAADATTAEKDEGLATEAGEGTLDLNSGMQVVLRKPDDGSEKKAKEKAQIEEEVAAWTRMITLGQWDEIKTFLAKFEQKDADKLYGHLLSKLASVPRAKDGASNNRNSRETPLTNFLSPEDILQITAAAPGPWKGSIVGNKKVTGGSQLSGKWQGKITVGGAGIPAGVSMPEIEFAMDIKLDGDTVSGTLEITAMGNAESVEFDGGSYAPDSGALSFTASKDGQALNVEMVVSDGKMTGQASPEDGPEMSMEITAELVEPGDPDPFTLDQDNEEGQGTDDADSADAAGSVAELTLPGGVQLPAGMSLDDLPAEIREQLQQASGGESAEKKSKPDSGGKSHVPALAKLISKSNKEGFDISLLTKKFKQGFSGIGGPEKEQRLVAAELLLKASVFDEVQQFLPSLNDSIKEVDLVSLKIWSQLSLKKYRLKQVAKWLDRAWKANIAITGGEETSQSDRDAAMANLIELSPKIDREIGQKWLDESFTESPERGMKILTNLGTKSSNMARRATSVDEDERLKLLRLQNGAAEKLLKVSPKLADQWSDALTLLADTWLKEAGIAIQYGSSNSSGGYWQYDHYGNSYYATDDQYSRYGGSRNRPRPIRVGDVLEIAPGDAWRSRVRPTLKTQMQQTFAKLHLKVNEEEKAFPWIEGVAKQNPKVAKSLVHEFLKAWTKNHDPNADRRQRNRYVYFYGFDQKADGIPLTRSKQQRNLKELQVWIDRIRAMEIEDLDEKLLANAFTTCHSSAEVYDLERVRSVFGDLGNLKPETVAAISEKMRANLASNWRSIRNQEEKKTKRRAPEVQQEVLRGYKVASELAQEALAASPDNWELHLSLACLMFDENEYSQSVQKSSEFSDRRDRAFEQFQLAAKKYALKVTELEKKDQKTDAFDRWFYASLGAVDLGKITNKTTPVPKQYPLIRDAILALPGTLGESHMAKFANNMFTRMSPIKPEIKFRYLRGGFEIVEDHPRAWEARGLYDYYRDLVSELKLVAEIDGSHEVGSEQPFGVYVNLLHTKEIERESGGFGKYVQNQNSMAYSYNYGRPTEDYRDKFSDAVKQALEDHFEIQNVTFQSPEGMESLPAGQEGWRVTPYAYLLLKSRGNEVDRLAPFKLDMDFLDTSGYVVIPIESPAIVIDATKSASSRPVKDLEITQTLDERQAEEGKLIVEVTATAKGLVPDLDEIVNLDRDHFEVVNVDDQGVLPARFDKESEDIQIISERSWSVEYCAKENQSEVGVFSFADAKLDEVETKFQRYEDVDLVETEQDVSLERQYSNAGFNFLYWLVPLIAMMFLLAGLVVFLRKQPATETVEKFTMPEDVNPFTVLTLLRDIRQRNGIANEKAIELENSIQQVERSWFGKEDQQQPDLQKLARTWIEQAK